MRKLAFVALLLAACGRRDPGLTIAITADGLVKFEGKAITLDELGNLLAERRDAAPLEEIQSARVSSLPVLLDIENDAAWLHVQWVMTVLAEQKFWRLSLPGGRDFPLPCDSGLVPISVPPDGKALLVRVMVLESGAYAMGDRRTRDVGEIGTWIDAAPHDGVLRRFGEIGAQAGVTWRPVRPVFDLLRARGMNRVDFPIAIPSLKDRAKSPLASHSRGEPVRWSGLFVVDYWSGVDRYRLEDEGPFPPGEGILPLLDDYRRALSIPELLADRTLQETASAHAEEMRRMNYFGHFSPVPGNRSPGDRLAKLGWPEARRHAELLAKGETAEAAFHAILAKPENAKVLADPALRYAGIAQAGDCWVVLLGAE